MNENPKPPAGDDIRAVEQKLREREEMFRQVVENIQEVFWMTDTAKTRMYYVSPGYEQIWGRPCQELYDSPRVWAEAIHPDDRARVLEYALARQVSGEYDEEYRIIRPNGQVRWIHARAFPVRDGAGKVTRIVGIAEDITERKWTEELLRKSEAQVRAVFENAVMGMALVGTDTQPIKCNRFLQKMLGYSEEEFQGMTFMTFTHPDDVMADLTLYRELLAGKREHYQIEKRYLRKDRKIVSARLTVSLVAEAVYGQICAIAMVEDLTEKKRLEGQFQRSQRLESIGNLAAGVAHDLNNMLSPILTASDLLERAAPDPSSRQLAGVIKSSAERGARMVGQMLTFARGGGERRYVVVTWEPIIQELTAIARETFPQSIRVATSMPEFLWPVLGDPAQLHRVLLNLCVNARDAMPAGGELTITAENVQVGASRAALDPDARPGPHVVIRVKDTGMGIEPGQQQKIFEPFFTTKGGGKGTGLGLSIIRGLVKDHGGFIHFRSAPGQGTVFECWFPAKVAGGQTGGPVVTAASEAAGGQDRSTDGQAKHHGI